MIIKISDFPCNFHIVLVKTDMRVIHPVFLFVYVLFASISTVFAQQNNAVLPVAISGNIAGDTASTRFFLDFDRELNFKTTYMENPYRIIIDLDEVAFDLQGDSSLQPRGIITSVRFGRIAQGSSRIVLTLSSPVEIIKSSFKKRLDEETYRLLLDLDSTDAKTYADLLTAQQKKPNSRANLAIKGDRVRQIEKSNGRFTIVLDPGHGGIDGGAEGANGAKEKNIVLAFAKLAKQKLEAAGPFDVLLTREEDKFMSLKKRLEFNRRVQADLFISIHADSLRQRFVRGSTIYTLSKKASDQFSERLAESENSVDLVAGLALEQEEEDAVVDILVDLTTSETKRFSRRFSSILVKRLGEEIRLIKNPQRSAAFGVLKAPEVPSVLLELGYLSNKEDEKLLQNSEWQSKAANALTKSVFEFFKPQMR
jgi:N-acetylmuramoyl-L-alanine amidase